MGDVAGILLAFLLLGGYGFAVLYLMRANGDAKRLGLLGEARGLELAAEKASDQGLLAHIANEDDVCADFEAFAGHLRRLAEAKRKEARG